MSITAEEATRTESVEKPKATINTPAEKKEGELQDNQLNPFTKFFSMVEPNSTPQEKDMLSNEELEKRFEKFHENLDQFWFHWYPRNDDFTDSCANYPVIKPWPATAIHQAQQASLQQLAAEPVEQSQLQGVSAAQSNVEKETSSANGSKKGVS